MRLLWPLLLLVACGSADTDEPAGASSPFPAAALVSASGTKLQAELRTRPDQPPYRGPVEAELRLRDAQGAPAAGRKPTVTPWMPSMGHGSNKNPTAEETSAGVYLLHDLEFSMPGRWELVVEADGERLVLPLDVQ